MSSDVLISADSHVNPRTEMWAEYLAPEFRDQVHAATNGRGLDHAFDFAGVQAVREQADGERAPRSADAVNGDRAHGVVGGPTRTAVTSRTGKIGR